MEADRSVSEMGTMGLFSDAVKFNSTGHPFITQAAGDAGRVVVMVLDAGKRVSPFPCLSLPRVSWLARLRNLRTGILYAVPDTLNQGVVDCSFLFGVLFRRRE